VAPLDLDPHDTSDSTGTVATVVDLATGTEKSDVALNSVRRTRSDVAASQQAGSNIAVYDSFSVISLASDPSGKPYLPASPERYAFDRTTTVMVATAGANVGGVPITAEMIGDDTIMPLKMPFFSEPKTYNVFDSSIMKGAPAEYIATEDVQGLSTYKYEQKIPATEIGKQGDATIMYQNDTVMYAEPLTGQVVNGWSTAKQWLRNADGTDGLILLDGKIGFTDQEVTDSVAQAKTNSSKLNMLANVAPVVCLVLGLLLLVGGLVLARRPDESGTASV
jgi:hypothetical protein